ncbi:hypothetical protein YC2023_010475 [Brassica napus]
MWDGSLLHIYGGSVSSNNRGKKKRPSSVGFKRESDNALRMEGNEDTALGKEEGTMDDASYSHHTHEIGLLKIRVTGPAQHLITARRKSGENPPPSRFIIRSLAMNRERTRTEIRVLTSIR